MKKRAIIMHPNDNVATTLVDVDAGDVVSIENKAGEAIKDVRARQPIPFGHKIALKEMRKSERVLKYGEVIGQTSGEIEAGEHVHIHNVESRALEAKREM